MIGFLTITGTVLVIFLVLCFLCKDRPPERYDWDCGWSNPVPKPRDRYEREYEDWKRRRNAR